jgi:23S rRNA pseudouridine1911/1915/1917 synthase
MAFLGCPVVGDRVYGRKRPSLPLERQFLHAQRLTIVLPGEADPRLFEAPLPGELQAVLANLRRV